ncbi:type VI secretion system tube protein Hcp [Paraburkholderia diazotrophica]|uniref:Hcp family type VI secretion system effector n=1 Tax=Paraburkholderia diazotrophica TaxID=667676 RepID=UPI00317CF976
MASDIFIEIDGIKGESQDVSHRDAIDVIHWEFSIAQNSTMHSGSGGGAAKASVTDLIFKHELDRASPNIASYCFQGKHIREAKLTMRKAGGIPHEYFRIVMYDVIIAKSWPSADGGYAIETVALSFARMKQEYILQNAIGGNAGTVTALIDVRANRAT